MSHRCSAVLKSTRSSTNEHAYSKHDLPVGVQQPGAAVTSFGSAHSRSMSVSSPMGIQFVLSMKRPSLSMRASETHGVRTYS